MVPDVKHYTPSIVERIGTKGTARSIEARLNHTLRMPSLRIKKFLEFSDKITIPVTLEELRAVANNKNTRDELEQWCQQLEKKRHPSRPISAQYLDKNGVPLFYYLGERIEDEPPKEYTLTDDRWQNFEKQVEKRQQIHLASAKREGKEIICDGFKVSFMSFCFQLNLCIYSLLG